MGSIFPAGTEKVKQKKRRNNTVTFGLFDDGKI